MTAEAKWVAALLLLTGTLAHAAFETRATILVSKVPIVGVSEASQGHSDANWVVANLANGIWGTPPFYPGQQWMARHIAEPGFDIWCRLDFGKPFTLEQIRLGNSCLGSFVHLKTVELEFEDGSRLPLSLARTRDPQSFDLPRVTTSWVKIHLRSHYGDGSSIDVNSGGLAEVECYGLVPGRAERGTVPHFAVARTGGITSWLVAPGLSAAEQASPWPVEDERAPEPAGHWRLLVSATPEVRLDGGKGGLAFCSLRAEQPTRCRLALVGAALLTVNGGPAADPFAVGPDGWTDLLVAVQGEAFSAALLDESGRPATAVRVGVGAYANPESRQRGWLEQLVRLRPAKPFIRPGQPVRLIGIPDGLGYPCFPVAAFETVTEVGPVNEGAGGAPFVDLTAPGRYRVTGKLLPFGISRESVLTVSPWAAEDGGPVPKGFTDLDGDGDPDVLRTTLRGYDVLIVDDDDDMTLQTTDRDADSDLIMVDKDRDLVFDGPDDFYYDAVDLDGDGDCDIEYYSADQIVKTFLDLDDDNVLTGSLDWAGFSYGNEMAHTGSTNYLQDVHGNGYFHNGRIGQPDLRYAWETPIAWYDFTGKGYTDLVMRVTELGGWDRRAEEFEVAFNIDADSAPGNECDLDFMLTYTSYTRHSGPEFDVEETFPALRGIPEADVLFTGNLRLRTNTRRIVFPYAWGYELGTTWPAWESCFLIWDEDDEDPRWEEMFGLNEPDWQYHADHVGDRIEEDLDFSGGGRLYRGAFDGRWHLFGADKAEWLVDYHGLYHGCVDRQAPDDLPPPPAGLRFPRVKYEDTNGNGFIDRISYDDDGDPTTWERVVDLLRYGSDEAPLLSLAPDGRLARTRTDDWGGGRFEVTNNAWSRLHQRFLAESQSDWQAALALYRAARARGWATSEALPECTLPPDLPMAERGRQTEYLLRPGYAGLLTATTPADQARNAYWLREKVFADVLARVPEAHRATAERLYYTGQVQELARQVGAGDL